MKTIDIRPERQANESFEDYKIRRKFNNLGIKSYLKGQLVYDSSQTNIMGRRIPYVKETVDKPETA